MDLIKSAENRPLTEKEIDKIITKASKKYGEFLTELGFDWINDEQMRDTPVRVAKMYIDDLFSGCYIEKPIITAFNNEDKYDGMVFQGNISVKSICAHHNVPFIGVAHVAYIPSVDGKVIGLSKLNRIVDFFSRRPQIQENLTMQIHNYINSICEKNNGVAVVIEAQHLCVKVRGIKHDSMMKTSKLSGAFLDIHGAPRQEFYDFITQLKD